MSTFSLFIVVPTLHSDMYLRFYNSKQNILLVSWEAEGFKDRRPKSKKATEENLHLEPQILAV